MEFDMRVSMIPATPRVGHPVSVLIRPYMSSPRENGKCCEWLPVNLSNERLRVEARSPAGQKDQIRVNKSVDPRLWQGGFVFWSAGRWRVTVSRDLPFQRPMSVEVLVRQPRASA